MISKPKPKPPRPTKPKPAKERDDDMLLLTALCKRDHDPKEKP